MNHILCLSIFCAALSTLSCTKNQVEIQSCILRDRVIVTDHVFMKKALYVALTVTNASFELENTKAKAQLFCKGNLLSESSTISSSEKTLNIVFDLPYEIPDASCTIMVSLLSPKHRVIAKCTRTIERSELRSSLDSRAPTIPLTFKEMASPIEPVHFEPKEQEKTIGYMLFSHSPLEYVFPGTRPLGKDLIDHLSLTVCRNEFEPITFSIYSTKDLGKVKINIEDLAGPTGIIAKDKIEVGHVDLVQDTIGCPKGSFRYMPRLTKLGDQVLVEKCKTKRFWLTLRVDRDVFPGSYSGNIIVSPQQGKETHLPLSVTVVPIVLEDIPNVDYCMLMTYEFTELTMPHTKQEQARIYEAACKVLQDYMEHGMTTICPHSPFVLISNEDGSPNLDDIFAALWAARDTGFRRPIIWYMGHLIQTAKPKHPGNITGFDKTEHITLLKTLVERVTEYSKENDCPEVIILPIDEPDDDYQDYKNRRRDITPVLLEVIKRAGARSMLTARNTEDFKAVDYICSSKSDPDDLKKAHSDGKIYWVYNNIVTTQCRNPAYSRYIYGYYTWMNDLDGMSSWTFQNTQNASGLPTLADEVGKDLYLAYPAPDGPLATINWEAIREGIDDYKLIYQLTKRVKKLENKEMDTSKYVNLLDDIKEAQDAPGWHYFSDYNTWTPSFFEHNRDRIISLILEADKNLTEL